VQRAARGSLKYRTQKVAKNDHLGTIAQICRAISSQLRHRQSEKKLVKKCTSTLVERICEKNAVVSAHTTNEYRYITNSQLCDVKGKKK